VKEGRKKLKGKIWLIRKEVFSVILQPTNNKELNKLWIVSSRLLQIINWPKDGTTQ